MLPQDSDQIVQDTQVVNGCKEHCDAVKTQQRTEAAQLRKGMSHKTEGFLISSRKHWNAPNTASTSTPRGNLNSCAQEANQGPAVAMCVCKWLKALEWPESYNAS